MAGLALPRDPQLSSAVTVRSSERSAFTEYHLTGTVSDEPGGVDPVGAVLDSVADAVAELGIEPIQEKLYGLAAAREEVLEKRRAAFERHGLDASLPVTFVEGPPLGGAELAGVQLWGIAPRAGARVRTIDGAVPGRSIEGPGFRMVYLPSVYGADAEGTLTEGGPAQADRMFANARAALASCGLSYSQVVRTWIYLPRLLDWYGELNRVRTRHYAPEKFGVGPGDRPFPASTGIQGGSGTAECFMDVLALEATAPHAVEARPLLWSARQGQSFSYGSAFSRGMSLAIGGRRTVHVSGTASIDGAGRTVHVGDREGQVLETLLCVAALLEEVGGGLANITMSTLFCKDRETLEAFRRVTRLLRVPAFPVVPVLADVCRPDLLVELEAVAVVS
jgi:enamine deaminase RidA (YjgF/YER057c/UK114 family)